MNAIHPKTSAAGLGAALGVVIVSVLASINGVHLSAEANAAIPAFLASLGAWLAPGAAPTPTAQEDALWKPPPPPSQ